MESVFATYTYLGAGPGGQNAIPKGNLRPDAKTSIRFGFAAPSVRAQHPDSVRTLLSETKISPLGATRTRRGLCNPLANS